MSQNRGHFCSQTSEIPRVLGRLLAVLHKFSTCSAASSPHARCAGTLLLQHKIRRTHFVLERGLEPPWGCPHYDLNVARLPISPLQQVIALSNAVHAVIVALRSGNLTVGSACSQHPSPTNFATPASHVSEIKPHRGDKKQMR